MGKIDADTKELLKKNREFADVVNLALYNGEPVIKPEYLSELDSAKQAVILKNNAKESVQKIRDVLKKVSIPGTDREFSVRLVVGLEAQAKIHFAAPVKCMIYDGLDYAEQISVYREKHMEEKSFSSGDEFLSGLNKDDKLIPVITIVVSFKNEEWDGPLSLHEMLDFGDLPGDIVDLVPDYRILLVSPKTAEDCALQKLLSPFKDVFSAIKHSNNKDDLFNYLLDKREMPRYAAEVIHDFCAIKIPDDGKEVVNMCQAVLDMQAESEAIGEARGRAEGEIIGAIKFALKHGMSVEDVAEETNMTVDSLLDFCDRHKIVLP